ncbi:peptidase family M48-domain-containing protein [Dimargaris cristalligena]|uniref:Peptidase family M48-domain-containing protein n=1 Tax=Dimargaris cristalligena TaxID=215637 RepID=A0A4P9ZRH9_9FUNG|nr:peptidase family M48-domain-containing protein [Dimargaris cristalligena]|eukprot:RKP36124.1 peptidase family M48-domain-containing protein [Dimargaris cristalligena]
MGVYYVAHLEEAPISGRRRFMAVSNEDVENMAKHSYQEIMREFGHQMLPASHRYTAFVRRVATRIIKAGGMENLDWEFHVIESPEANAFVIPGGKVFVFTGLLPIVKNEDGLATVLGHEIAHQLLGHHAERMSYGQFLSIIQMIVSIFFDPTFSGFNRMFLELGILLPNSRKCETEADHVGLQLMAQACFDPQAAIGVWERMAKLNKFKGSFEYLQTHPSSEGRIEKMRKWMPEAEQKRADSDCQQGRSSSSMIVGHQKITAYPSTIPAF